MPDKDKKRTNIIFYFTDQQRADTCGCYGQPLEVTPHLDKLAEDGVCFEQAFSPQPVCGPCRAIFQTGRYATETGCFRNNIMLPHDVKTLAEYMEEAGMETAYVGKWHLASSGGLTGKPEIDHTITAVPQEYRGGYTGFWRAADVLEFTSHGYDGYVFDEDNRRRDFTGYRADAMTDFALEFLEKRDRTRPFFMVVSQIEPHHQNDRGHYEGPEGSKERFKNFVLPHDLEALGGDAAAEYPDYLGACERLDYNLGRIVERLKEEGIYENTCIVYASDHGSHFKTRNHDEHMNGIDDYKRSCHDASIHVPLVIAGPGFRGGRRVQDLVSTESLPKTFLAMAGVDVGDKMIGENLKDVADGKTEGRANRVFAQISESRVSRMIRTPDFTYSVVAPGANGFEQAAADSYTDDFLYDLKEDPYELNNVVFDARYAEVKEKLRRELYKWIEKAEGFCPGYVPGKGPEYSIQPFSAEEAEEIVSWLNSEYEMRLWSAWTFPHYPITAEELLSVYEARRSSYYYPLSIKDEKGRLTAHILLRAVSEEPAVFRLAHFILEPSHRGQGLAHILLDKVIRYAREELGARKLLLAVFTHNVPAYLTYRHAGFERTGEVNQYYHVLNQVWEVVEMKKDL